MNRSSAEQRKREMDTHEEKPLVISQLKPEAKRTWKMHQTVDELYKWSAFLQMSAERFLEEFTEYNSRLTSLPTREKKVLQEAMERLQTLKKESSLLKAQARRLHGRRQA